MARVIDRFWSGARMTHHHLARKGGPKQNSWPKAKIDVRRWIAERLGAVGSVYEVYGGGGLGTDCWRNLGATRMDFAPRGVDALDALRSLECWEYDVWDVDPYSNCFTAIEVIAERATGERIGMFLTDGCLRKEAQIRGHLPKEVVRVTGWDDRDRALKAWIFCHYPAALRRVCDLILAPRYRIEDMRVVRGRWRSAANYAGIIASRS